MTDVQRTVTKVLATQQDLLFGEGQIQQTRSGGVYLVDKIRGFYPCNSQEELAALDPEKFPKAVLVTETQMEFFRHNGTQYISFGVNATSNNTYVVFTNVAEMKVAVIPEGTLVYTKGYYTPADGGNGIYLSKSPETADGFVDHNDAAGNKLELISNIGDVTPLKAGARADGSDDIVFLEKWLDYLLSKQDLTVPSQATTFENKSSNQALYDWGGKSYRISRTLFFKDFRQCKFTSGSLLPLDGFTDLYLASGDGWFQSDVEFNINFMCRHLTDSYFTGGHIRTKFTGIMHGFIANNVWHSSSQRECIFDDCLIAQYIFGEPGYDVPSNITAFAANLQGTDSIVTDTVIVQNTRGFNVPFGGNIIKAHIYGPNEMPAITLGEQAQDNKIDAYIDNSYIRILGSFKANSFDNSKFVYNRTDTNFTFFRIEPQTSNYTLAGLSVQNCTLSSSQVDINMFSVDETKGNIGRLDSTTIIKDNVHRVITGTKVEPFTTHLKLKRVLSNASTYTFDLSPYLSQIPGSDVQDATVTLATATPAAVSVQQVTGSDVTSLNCYIGNTSLGAPPVNSTLYLEAFLGADTFISV